jgi:hypothetical protein
MQPRDWLSDSTKGVSDEEFSFCSLQVIVGGLVFSAVDDDRKEGYPMRCMTE